MWDLAIHKLRAILIQSKLLSVFEQTTCDHPIKITLLLYLYRIIEMLCVSFDVKDPLFINNSVDVTVLVVQVNPMRWQESAVCEKQSKHCCEVGQAKARWN